MGVIPVDLPKKVKGEDLEKACMKAAEEMGYKARPTDEFRKRYSLGSIQEHRDYIGTHIRIRNFLPMLQVSGVYKLEERDRFYITTGFPFGIASKARVQQYLSNVSKYLC